MKRDEQQSDKEQQAKPKSPNEGLLLYRVVFRNKGQVVSCYSRIANLALDEVVMVQTDHGLEPGRVFKKELPLAGSEIQRKKPYFTIVRRANRDEIAKYDNLIAREEEAAALCRSLVGELHLQMKLISVERYFNGSKILFYFTADNRVDFRELVKRLVQEFRTRVEMKQIGVRHETKMLGGVGCCGRELCCSSFIGKFAPVSIKMAKEQELPLNPLKISGVCNRLLCCLTHEYSTYKTLRKDMPRPGRFFTLDGKRYKILQVNVLSQSLKVISDEEDGPIVVTRDEWKQAVFEPRAPREPKGEKKKVQNKGRTRTPIKNEKPQEKEGKKGTHKKRAPQAGKKKKQQSPQKIRH